MQVDRPYNAQDKDVTFRSTEPAMIAAGTYAPLELFAWFQKHRLIAGRIVDIYQMARRVRPPLSERHVTGNGDGTGFIVVRMGELVDANALLRTGDPQSGWERRAPAACAALSTSKRGRPPRLACPLTKGDGSA